jgi:hypothetical protein
MNTPWIEPEKKMLNLNSIIFIQSCKSHFNINKIVIYLWKVW